MVALFFYVYMVLGKEGGEKREEGWDWDDEEG
jgi:hypothetical protein